MTKATETQSKRRKRTAKSNARSKGKTITLEVPDGQTVEEAETTLAKSVPGWENLNRDQKRELAEIALAQRDVRQPVQVTLTRKPEGGLQIDLDQKCEALALLKLQKIFGAVTMDPVNARANELLNYLGSVNAETASRYNAALSFIESMEPQNQAEVLLLVQMYATHDAAIRSLSQLGKAEWVDNARMFGNLSAKLLAAYRTQFESINKTRRGGEQVIRHVHVDNRGGQAVFADSVQTGGQNEKLNEQSQATRTASKGTAMLGQDAEGNGVPVTSGERQEEVPNARRNQSGRA